MANCWGLLPVSALRAVCAPTCQLRARSLHAASPYLWRHHQQLISLDGAFFRSWLHVQAPRSQLLRCTRLQKGARCQAKVSKFDELQTLADLELAGETPSSVKSPTVNWYPGHIAKAEKQLKEQLTMVDVVLEVRDARIPESSRHPDIPKWCGTKPRLLVMNRVDMVSPGDQELWNRHFSQQGQRAFWTNGEQGTGVQKLIKAALAAASSLNERRRARGLKARPIRAVVIGFPNVGKSALINRLMGKRLVDSAPRPGVTRALRWLRMDGDLDMLDAPGVLPMNFSNQTAAQRLAMCNNIGEASYLDSRIAATLVDTLARLPAAPEIAQRMLERLKVDPATPGMTGEDYVIAVASKLFQHEEERAGARILREYRTGAFGHIALELPKQRSSPHHVPT